MGTMLGGGGRATTPERYAGMQVSASLMGQVIPYVTGRTRVPQNLIWYGNFQSSGSKSGGKGGGGPSSWNYSAAWIGALCLGPITGIYTVWHDQSIVNLAYENLGFALGATGQATWASYPAGTPSVQQIPYSGIAYVATNSYFLGSSPSMPNLTYEVEGGGTVGGYSDAHGMYDSDPSAVIVDYLTNPVHGAGFQGSIATLTGTTNTYQAYVQSLGLLVSLNEKTQRAATTCMQELMQITNSDFVISCGTLKVLPYADKAVSATTPDGVSWSYTPNLTPLYSFTDSDYCPREGDEPVKLARKSSKNTYNIVNVEYLDRSTYYNPSPASAQDNADIASRGPRPMSTVTLHQITSASVAKTVAQLILQFQLYERNTWEFRVRADYSLLEPMDLIALTDSAVGLNGQVCRIIEVDDDADNFITIKAMEVPGTVRNTPQYNWAANAGYAANFDAAPGSVATPAIFQMPPVPGSLSEGITLGMAVCGPTSAAFWGGCQVYCSADGGNTYEWVGSIGATGPARYGTTTAAISAVADPDTTTTLPVALANTTLQLSTAVTHAEADAAQTLILVGSGTTAEVMSYGTGALVSAGNYNLTYLRRGQYGSTNQAHASGVQFVRLDGSIFQLPIDPGFAGQTLYFKFCSFNSVGRNVQALSAATAYSYTVPSALPVSGTPVIVPRGSCAVSGQAVYKATTGTNGWDSDCVSSSAYGALEVSGQYGGGVAQSIGIASSVASTLVPGSTAGYFCISCNTSAPNVDVYFGSTLLYSSAVAPAKNDLHLVTYDGFTYRAFVNGVLVAQAQSQGNAAYVGIAMWGAGGVYGNVRTASGSYSTPSQFEATGNCVVNDTNAMKIGGTSNWDSCVYSITGYLTCHITAKPNTNGQHYMIGLSTQPVPTPANLAANQVYYQANYAWYYEGTSGTWQIYESGTAVVTGIATAQPTDVVAITYDGSNVIYWLNGVAQSHSVAVAGLRLYGFCPFGDAGGGINSLRFGPTTSLALPVTGGAALLNARGTCVLSGQMISKPSGVNGWDGDAVSGLAYAAGAIQAQLKLNGIYFTQALGFISAVPASPTINPTSGSGNGYFGFQCASAAAYVIVNGAVAATLAAPATNDLWLVTYDGFTFRYYVNNSLVWSAPDQAGAMYFIVGFYGPGVNYAFVDLQLTTGATATPSQFKAINTATVNDTNAMKAGTTGWNNDTVVSAIGYPTCHITAKINAASNNNAVFGLLSNPGQLLSYGTANPTALFNFSWDASTPSAGSSHWLAIESGTTVYTSSGAPLPTDVAWITYDGSNVNYYLNDPTTPVHTTAAAGLNLWGAATFYEVGSGINSLRFGPTTNLAVADTAQLGANAATNVYTSAVAGPIAPPATFGTIAPMDSVTVGPFPYATTCVVTAFATYDNSSTTKSNQLNYGLSPNSTSFTSEQSIAVPLATAAGDALGLLAQEYTYSLAANTTQTYYLNASVPPTPAWSIPMINIEMKVEVIKK
jgi:hypothetical protein